MDCWNIFQAVKMYLALMSIPIGSQKKMLEIISFFTLLTYLLCLCSDKNYIGGACQKERSGGLHLTASRHS